MRIRGLDFAYGRHRVFEGFSWETDAEIAVLRGPSGCGKSTLLQLLGGALTPRAYAEFPNTNGAYLILQEDALLPWLTGTENVALFLRRSSEQVAAHPYFELIAEFADALACTLSYGQRRSVELCRALIARPATLLLDEPFNYLDPERRRRFASHLSELAATGCKVLLASHYDADTEHLKASVYSFDGALPVRCLR